MAVDITDVTGNNLHLTNISNVLYNSEGLTPYYTFSGSNYLYYPDASATEFNITGSEGYVNDNGLTLMCWARNDSANLTSDQYIVCKDDINISQRQYGLLVNSNEIGVFFVSTDGSTNASVPTVSVSDPSVWNFYCGRWVANSVATMFVNDSSSIGASASPPLFVGSADFTIGCRLNNSIPASYWDGDISMVGVYASALSDDQILTIYDMTAPLFKTSI